MTVTFKVTVTFGYGKSTECLLERTLHYQQRSRKAFTSQPILVVSVKSMHIAISKGAAVFKTGLGSL